MLEQAPSVINTLDASNVWCVILCNGSRVTPRVPRGLNALAWNVVRARDVDAKSPRRPKCLGSVMWTAKSARRPESACAIPVPSHTTTGYDDASRRAPRCHRGGCVSV